MFNFKNFKITTCFLFIFLVIVLPIGNVFATDTFDPLNILLLINPVTMPLGIVNSISQLTGSGSTTDLLGTPILIISKAIVAAIGSTMTTTGAIIMTFGQTFLTSAITSSTTWLSPTDFNKDSETYNSVVAEGWGIVRNVANAALIIGLVIIAINIILGREENKAKKSLIYFIIIALLINFTPVICGFIIDGSNILTKSFVTGGIDGSFVQTIAKNIIGQVNSDMLQKDPGSYLTISIIYLIFALLCFFIFTLYALLFVCRSLILWILVIVSPIAFATYVFPQSKYIKKVFPSVLYWDDWWESFLQWCVVGIPAGMSIYLANKLIPHITISAVDVTSINTILGSLINYIFQALTPFIILIAGFFISISSGTKAASKLSAEITNFSKQSLGWAGGAALGVAGGAAGAGAGYLGGRSASEESSKKSSPIGSEYSSSNRPTGEASLALLENRPIPGSPNPVTSGSQNYSRRSTNPPTRYDYNLDELESEQEIPRTESPTAATNNNSIKNTPQNKPEANTLRDNWTRGKAIAQQKGFVGSLADAGGKIIGGTMGTVAGAIGGGLKKEEGSKETLWESVKKGAIKGGKEGLSSGAVGTTANISGSIATTIMGEKAGGFVKGSVNKVGGTIRDAGLGATQNLTSEMIKSVSEAKKQTAEEKKAIKKAKEELKEEGKLKDGVDID